MSSDLVVSSRRVWPARLVAALFLAAGFGQVSAQHYAARTYTEADGLPSSQILSMGQDDGGRMWFVTRSTVAIHDGATWEELRAPDGAVMRDFHHVLFDRERSPWLVRHSGAFTRRVGDNWIDTPPRERVAGVARARRVGLLDSEEGPTLFVGLYVGGLDVWFAGKWHHYRTSDGITEMRVLALAASGSSMLIGTERGLFRYRNGTISPVGTDVLGLPSGPIRGLATQSGPEGDTERIWIQSATWLGYVEDGRFIEVLSRESFPVLDVNDTVHLLADGNRGVYRGDRATVQFVDLADKSIVSLGRKTGLSSDGLRALFRDRERNVWIASDRGVSRLASLRFTNLDSRSGLLADEVTAILERRSGEFVLGHNNGLTFIDGTATRTVQLAPDNWDVPGLTRVLDLDEDASGNLWVAAANLGLGRIDPDGSLNWIPSRFEGQQVSSVEVLDDGEILVAGHIGLGRVHDGRLVKVDDVEGPPCCSRRVQQGPDGRVFVSTIRYGLYVRDAGRWSLASHGGREGLDKIYGVHVDTTGRTWVASGAGLLLLRSDRLEVPAESELRFDRPVYFIVEDHDGHLWFGTDRGVLRWDGHALRRYDRQAGLAGNETNRAAGVVDRSGALWIGTDGGVSRFNVRYDSPVAPPPIVRLLEMGTRKAAYAPDRELALRASENDVTFAVRAISFAGDRVALRFRLDGYDARWSETKTLGRHELRYTNLPPGDYRLRVQGRNANGEWSPVGQSAGITVAGPFWSSWWFTGLCLLTAILLWTASHRYMLGRTHSRELESRVRERTAELHRSQRAIDLERERLAAVLSSVADGVIATDPSGRVTMMNPAAERLTGTTAEAALERRLVELLSLTRESEPRRLVDSDTLLVPNDGGAPGPSEAYLMLNEAGESRALEIRVARLQAESENRGFVVAVQDITERRRSEEQLARAARLGSLGALARGIAHDFNNVLTAASGHVALAAGEDGAELSNLVAAERAIERAAGLSRQLLTFARGGEPLTKPLEIARVIRDSTRLALSGSKIACDLRLPADLWMVEADESQLNQVFENLLINARQAMPEGGRVTITAENEKVGGSARQVRIAIRDEGPGIAKQDLPKVFDPFFTTKSSGTGLGLATTHSIVTRHGGTIDVESEPGQGAAFMLVLPASADHSKQSASVEVAVPRPTTRSRVLVMDDDTQVREMLGAMLSTLGFDVALSADGADAIKIFDSARADGADFDAVVLDLTVPGGMGGLETLQCLRAIEPCVRAIASSGYSDDSVMARYIELGFVGILPKPYTQQDVIRVLDACIDGARRRAVRSGNDGPQFHR